MQYKAEFSAVITPFSHQCYTIFQDVFIFIYADLGLKTCIIIIIIINIENSYDT